jgi:2-oxoisovalerate dehydrogenase E1 component
MTTAVREINYMQATLEALDEEMAKDPTIFVLGEGIGKRGGNFNTTLGLYEKYGAERLCDTPIAERGFIGLCAGAAMTGTRPIVDFMFIDFALDAMGEMLNQIAKVQYMSSGRLKMPVVLRGSCGILGSAATHHSGSYYPTFVNVPGFRVALPSNAYDAKGLFKSAVVSDDPVLFLEHRALLPLKCHVPEEEYYIPFGQAKVVREGTDATIVALTISVHKCAAAAEELAKEGMSFEIIDPRTVAPLDIDTILESVAKTGRLLIVDENFGPCGIGAEVAAQVMDRAFDELDAPIRRLNGMHTPTPYSPTLEQAVIPTQEELVQTMRDLIAE